MHPSDQSRLSGSATAQGGLILQGIRFLDGLSTDTVLGQEIQKRSASARDDLLRTAEEQRLRLAVLGETSSGKSTFINALLGVDLLASDLEPTTAVSTRLTFGPAFQVEVTRGDQVERLWNRRRVDVEAVRAALDCVAQPEQALLDPTGRLLPSRRPAVVEFIRNATTEGGSGRNVDDVTIRLPSRYLAAAIDILDTPGFNPGLADADQRRHLAVTRRSIESSHLALFLIDARNPLKSTEERFLREFSPSLSRVFFIANKMDLLDEDEAADTEDYIRSELATKFGFPPEEVTIYFISSIPPGAGGSSQHSDALKQLRNDIVAFMQQSRTALVMDRAARTFAEQAEGLQVHAEKLAEGYRVRLEQLHARQITDVAQMQEIVSEAVERAYQQAVAHASIGFGKAIDKRMAAALDSFETGIGVITDRTKVETTAHSHSESVFWGQFKSPLEQALLDELTKAIDIGMNAAHREFAALYDSMSLRQPNAVDRTRISNIARQIIGHGMSGQGIASSVEDARKRGDQARGIGAVGLGVVGAVIGGPVGAMVGARVGQAVGALFGPSIDELKQVAIVGFRRQLNEAGEKLRRVGDACFDGNNELIEDLLVDTIENQLGVYVKEVGRVISVHEATIETVKVTKTALERSAGQANDWADKASRVARGVRADLARSGKFGTPDFSPVLDPRALEDLSADAAGAVAAGGIRVPKALEQLGNEAVAVGHGYTPAQRDAIKSADHFACFVNAVGARIDEDIQQCLRDRQHFISWGLSPLDLAILLPVGPETVDRQTCLLASANGNALVAPIVDGLGSKFRHQHLRALQQDVDERFRFWSRETPSGLLAGVARIEVELRLRTRRRHLRLVLVGGAVAIAASVVVAAVAAGYRKAFPGSDIPQSPIGVVVPDVAIAAPSAPAVAQSTPDSGVPCRINDRERQVKFRAGPSHGGKPTAIGKRGDEGRCYELVNGWRRMTTPDGVSLGYMPEYLIAWPAAVGQGQVAAARLASEPKVELKPKLAQDPEDLPKSTAGAPASQ